MLAFAWYVMIHRRLLSEFKEICYVTQNLLGFPQN